MTDWRRVRVGATGIALLSVLAVAGCGVPTGGKPIIDGPGQTRVQGGASGGPPQPLNPASFSDQGQFVVDGYLGAVAGQSNLAGQLTAARTFMGPHSVWTPGSSSKAAPAPVSVVHVDRTAQASNASGGDVGPDPGDRITVSVEVIGQFDPASGAMTPPPPGAARSRKLKFSTYPNSTGNGYLLKSAPAGFIMTDTAMAAIYNPQMVYFWDGSRGLVPDLRYVPAWMKESQRATAVVDWILDGPPDWIGNAADPLVQNVSLAEPFVDVDNGEYTVNLSQTAITPTDEANLVAEIRWSLSEISSDFTAPGGLPQVRLQINSHPQKIDESANVIDFNQAAFRDDTVVAYAIDGGKVSPIGYVGSNGAVSAFDHLVVRPADPTKTLAAPENSNVVLAAIRSGNGEVDSALVRDVGGKQQLWVSRATTARAKYTRVNVPGTVFARPVWLPSGALAIVADGKFYLVANNSKNSVALVNVEGAGPITAFSVASDGHRVAFISHGAVWTGILAGGSAQPIVASGRSLNVSQALTSVGAVAWSSIDQLVLGGKAADGQAAVIEANADGLFPHLNSEYGETTIKQIVSYPLSPLAPVVQTSPVMVQTTVRSTAGRGGPVALKTLAKGTVSPMYPFFPD